MFKTKLLKLDFSHFGIGCMEPKSRCINFWPSPSLQCCSGLLSVNTCKHDSETKTKQGFSKLITVWVRVKVPPVSIFSNHDLHFKITVGRSVLKKTVFSELGCPRRHTVQLYSKSSVHE